MEDIGKLREEYNKFSLDESVISKNPIDQFKQWWDDVIRLAIEEANAMVLGTVDDNLQPSSRIVLLKSFSEEGFIFFTNYESAKGQHIGKNNKASLLFFWIPLERQVCIKGIVSKISRQESERYFHSRPLGSQIGAMVSNQSAVIAGREILEKKYEAAYQLYQNKQVPLPDYWGGYILNPISIEFWQGRPSRLHDRILYKKKHEAEWSIERLSP